MEEREEELILGTRNKVERNNKEETMKFLYAGALQSLQLYPHPHARTHAPPGSYIRTTLHTHTHTPLHTLTHTVVTPTHAHPSSYIGTTCAHPYTYKYLQISIAYNCHNTYLQISANIHTCIHLQISTLSHYSTY